MSGREEERNKNCPSRGLSIAAAAIGVGVGAALYYFFSNRQENPADEGATTSGWSSEGHHAFNRREHPADEGATTSGWSSEGYHALQHDSDSSNTTISEYSTTDTSIHNSSSSSGNPDDSDDAPNRQHYPDSSFTTISEYSTTDTSIHNSSSSSWNPDDSGDAPNRQHDPDSSFTTISEHSTTDTSIHNSSSFWNPDDSDDEASEWSTIGSDDEQEIVEDFNFPNNSNHISSDSETNTEWDDTNSSLDVPRDDPRTRSPLMMEVGEQPVRLINRQAATWKRLQSFRSAREQRNRTRDQAFRDRLRTLEECSICFESMLNEQELMGLACTHRFHQACIMPWWKEERTCPICRKMSFFIYP